MRGNFMTGRWSVAKSTVLAGLAVAVTSSAAFAQCTSVATGPGAPFFGPQLAAMSAAMSSAAGSFGSTLGNQSTAFLSQQGSAFVSAPNDPMPDQPGGGVWARGVGGELTTKFSSVGTGTVTSGPGVAIIAAPPFVAPVPAGALNTNATSNCAGSVHSTFAGGQVGTDISRLNVGGWNLHLGTTAGFLSSNSTDSGGGSTNIEVPFLGLYAVATKGRFFADIMVRNEFYNGRVTQQAAGLFNQELGARGVSVSMSAGYNFALANNWFIEPSAGFIWSRTDVDNVSVSGGLVAAGAGSVLTTSPIDSQIGRLSLRAGTTIASGNMIWQPFVSGSVFHEFAGNITSQSTSFPGAFGIACVNVPAPGCALVPVTISGTNSTTRVGTYGQLSLGLAGQIANTGWLGFVRGDYKYGNNLEGWTANAGIRYQFSPERFAAIMPVKAKAPPIVRVATNWTGFYVGGFAGVAYGSTDIRFVNDPLFGGNNPRVAGWLGGLQAGYNYHAPGSNWVFGVEGDVGGTNLHGTRACTNANNTPSTFLTCQHSADWMVTAAARVGYTWERTLFYVKAGGAWTDDKVNVGCILGPLNGNPIPPCVNPAFAVTNGFSTSGSRAGWLIGYGTEFDLGKNWSAKAEYTYMDLGERRALASDGQTVINNNGALSQVKVGVNYRFSPGAAVVAKF